MSFGFGFGFPRRAAAGGAAPSLNFDFTSLTSLPSRITFSRTSNATLTDSNGRVSYAPHNLLTNSEDFEASAWTRGNVNITSNSVVAPNGTTTADSLIATNVSGNHLIFRTDVTGANTYTLSGYAKAAGYNFLAVYLFSGAPTVQGVLFNIATGAFVSHLDSANQVTSYSISDDGNGWYRYSITSTLSLTQSGIALSNSATPTLTATKIPTFTGDGTSGIFIWGAQLNVANAPVNLLTFSEQFDNAAWIKRGTCAVTPNAIAAPDSTITADLISGVNTIGNDIYSVAATVPLNAPASPSFYINKVSTTGTLRVGNPSDSAKGNWHVNLALVDSGWQRITLGHPAVTVVTSFVGNGLLCPM